MENTNILDIRGADCISYYSQYYHYVYSLKTINYNQEEKKTYYGATL